MPPAVLSQPCEPSSHGCGVGAGVGADVGGVGTGVGGVGAGQLTCLHGGIELPAKKTQLAVPSTAAVLFR